MNKLGSVVAVVLSVSITGTAAASPLDVLPVDPPDLPRVAIPTPSIPEIPQLPSPIQGVPVPHVNPVPSAPPVRVPLPSAPAVGVRSSGTTQSAAPGAVPPQGGGPTGTGTTRPGGAPLMTAEPDRRAAAERRKRVVRRDRKLRRVVKRLESCLPQLPNAERRVAALRAGLGEKSTRTRARVAQLLNVTRRAGGAGGTSRAPPAACVAA